MSQESGPDDNGKQIYVAKNHQIFQYFLVCKSVQTDLFGTDICGNGQVI